MKTVILPTDTQIPPKEILKIVMGAAGAEGLTLGAIRERLRIMDKVESADKTIDLEDSEHATLKTAYEKFPFAQAHIDIVKIADAIDAAHDLTKH